MIDLAAVRAHEARQLAEVERLRAEAPKRVSPCRLCPHDLDHSCERAEPAPGACPSWLVKGAA